jgi:FtsH-binding integral membrane protein
MRNLASIKNYEDYKGVHMLMNQKIRRDFVAKMYGFFLTQMVISLFICSLTQFEPVKNEFKGKSLYLAFFIICFPLNLVISGFLSCGRHLLKNKFVQSLFISLGTIFITFIYFYIAILTNTKGIMSIILLQIAGAVGRLVYAIYTKNHYKYYDFYLSTVLFILIFEPIIVLPWTDNLLFIILSFVITCIFSIYLVYDINYTVTELDTKYYVEDFALCALIHYLGPFYFISRACSQTKHIK